jgi:hypothetical protein
LRLSKQGAVDSDISGERRHVKHVFVSSVFV